MKNIIYGLFSILCITAISMQLNAQTPQWQSVTDSDGAENESITQLSEDQEGNVFVLGIYEGEFSYANQMYEYSGNANPGVGDAFLTKLSSDGVVIWSISINHPNTRIPTIAGLANDSEGNTYLCGILQPTAPGQMITIAGFEVAVNPPNLMYMCKIDADGNGVWIKQYKSGASGPAIFSAPSLGIDSEDKLILSGSFNGTLDFDGILLQEGAGTFGYFTTKFDSDGNVLWATSFGSANSQSNLIMTVAPDDGVLLGGAWSGDSLFLGDLVVVNDNPLVNDNYDRWAGKLNSDGEATALIREAVAGNPEYMFFPTERMVRPQGIAPGPNGGWMVLSLVYQPINIGGEEITGDGLLLTSYNFEGQLLSVEFIADLSPSSTFPLAPSSAIISDGNGNYFYGATFSTPEITIGAETFTNSGGDAGTTDAVIVHCDASGQTNYVVQIGDAENESISRLRLMSTGQIQVAGTYNSANLTLGNEILENTGFLTDDFFLGYLDFTSGTMNVGETRAVSVFPNPTGDFINIDLNSTELINCKVSVLDMNGRVVMQLIQTDCEVKRLDVSALENGSYILDIQGAESHYVSKFIVFK